MNTLTSTIPPLSESPFSYPQVVGAGLFFVVAAVAANTFNSFVTLPFIAIAGAYIATKAVVKYLHHRYPEETKKFLLDALHFKGRYPHLQTVAFAITLIAALIWGALGCFFGILTGIYSGLSINKEFLKNWQPPQQTLNAQLAGN
jgi:hypothetical protein